MSALERRPLGLAGRSRRPLAVLAVSLGLGLAWIVTELVLTLSSGRAIIPAQLVDDMVRLLPWQLALFAAIGGGTALLARWRNLTWAAVGWWLIAGGTFAFLGEALLEGLLRKKGPAMALASLIGLALSLALLGAAAMAIRRRLRGRAGRGFTAAAWTGWSLFFLIWMQHSIAAIRLWEPGLEVLYAYLEKTSLIVALAGAALVWLVGSLSPAARSAILAAAIFLFPADGAVRASDQVASRPDVLVLLIDTWRFDHLGTSIGVEGLTPELDALARESILFARTFSPGNYTKVALPGILTSLPYRVVGHPLPEEVTTLAEHLKNAGYATYGISANPYVSDRFGYGQGFDRFLDPLGVNEFLVEGLLEAFGVLMPGAAYRLGLVTSALYYPPAAVVRQRALEFFRDSPGPTFVYLQTMDPHGPYLPPHRFLPPAFDYGDFESYFEFDSLKGRGVLGRPDYAQRLENLRQRYRGEVRFTDEEVGKLVAGLRESQRWDEMFVIVLSDHGEAFGEKDWAGHSGNNVSRTLVQVPFLVKPPRSWGIPGRVEASLVSTYDLLPTILDMLGLPPPESAFGRNLASLIRGDGSGGPRTVFSFGRASAKADLYTAVRWPWKLDVVLDQQSGEPGRRALYDLSQDPGELIDLATKHPDLANALGAAVRERRERENRAALRTESDEIDPLVREQLRKLGYIE